MFALISSSAVPGSAVPTAHKLLSLTSSYLLSYGSSDGTVSLLHVTESSVGGQPSVAVSPAFLQRGDAVTAMAAARVSGTVNEERAILVALGTADGKVSGPGRFACVVSRPAPFSRRRRCF